MKKLFLFLLLVACGLGAMAQKNALIKPVEWKGVTLTYWKITSVHWSMEYDQTWVDVCPYVSKAQSATGTRDFVMELRKQFSFPGKMLNFGNIYDSLRVSKIVDGKETQYFADAVSD